MLQLPVTGEVVVVEAQGTWGIVMVWAEETPTLIWTQSRITAIFLTVPRVGITAMDWVSGCVVCIHVHVHMTSFVFVTANQSRW